MLTLEQVLSWGASAGHMAGCTPILGGRYPPMQLAKWAMLPPVRPPLKTRVALCPLRCQRASRPCPMAVSHPSPAGTWQLTPQVPSQPRSPSVQPPWFAVTDEPIPSSLSGCRAASLSKTPRSPSSSLAAHDSCDGVQPNSARP
jgi:hypothetical protein